MSKYWLGLVIAALFEVGWVIGLKHADSLIAWGATLIAIAISFGVLLKISEKLPVGTVYAVFVGLGTVGTVIADIVLFGEALKIQSLLFIVLLLVGVVGLKLVTHEEVE